ncbi:hypothetical protein ACOBQX_30560 [Actinokineospora sp. G85]|uniref:hypothetical protein n=1 Tax=Actinokineospora sp. G85 TaxID=3406626 RepID=UPI003C754ADE
MRRMPALAAVATALPAALLAGCSNRPNDLYTYYDGAAPEVVSSSAAPPPAPPTSTTPPRPAPAALVATAGLTAADLAEEEVTAQLAPTRTTSVTLPDCRVALGEDVDAGSEASWTYSRGSVLRQYTVHTAETATLDEAKTAIDGCRSFKVDGVTHTIDEGATLGAIAAADDQLTWCATTTRKVICTVLLAKGNLVTAVSVESGTAKGAREAVTRIAPVAATALSRADRS